MSQTTKPYVIAEIGSNWKKFENQVKNWEVIKKQVNLAKEVGADAVKFQLFSAQELYGPRVAGTRFERDFDTFALHIDWVSYISDLCLEVGIDFLCSAFSAKAYRLINPWIKVHKIASPEITDVSITEYLTSLDKPIMYSDGCGLNWISPRKQDILFSCVSNYPAKPWEYDIDFDIHKGLSDHTLTHDLALMCRMKNMKYYEKHVDLCDDIGLIKSPDACVSVGLSSFKEYVSAIKNFDRQQFIDAKKSYASSYARVQKGLCYYRPIPANANLN